MCLLSSPNLNDQALQIAGRAGRFNTDFQEGEVTTFRKDDLPILKEILAAPVEEIENAGLHPTAEQIELFAYHLQDATLSNLIVSPESCYQSWLHFIIFFLTSQYWRVCLFVVWCVDFLPNVNLVQMFTHSYLKKKTWLLSTWNWYTAHKAFSASVKEVQVCVYLIASRPVHESGYVILTE